MRNNKKTTKYNSRSRQYIVCTYLSPFPSEPPALTLEWKWTGQVELGGVQVISVSEC